MGARKKTSKDNKTKDLLDVAGARRIAERVKLPAQFAALAPKVKEFFEHKAFGKTVDLNDMEVVRALPHTPPRPQGISA